MCADGRGYVWEKVTGPTRPPSWDSPRHYVLAALWRLFTLRFGFYRLFDIFPCASYEKAKLWYSVSSPVSFRVDCTWASTHCSVLLSAQSSSGFLPPLTVSTYFRLPVVIHSFFFLSLVSDLFLSTHCLFSFLFHYSLLSTLTVGATSSSEICLFLKHFSSNQILSPAHFSFLSLFHFCFYTFNLTLC